MLGGSGTSRYEWLGAAIQETFVAGEIPWASTGHNLDAYFFLRRFGANQAVVVVSVLSRRALMDMAQRSE